MPAAVFETISREAARVSEIASQRVHDDEMRLRGLREARDIIGDAAGDRIGPLVERIDEETTLLRGMREMQRLMDGEWQSYLTTIRPVATQLDEEAWVRDGARPFEKIVISEPEEYVSQTIVDNAPDRYATDTPFDTPADLDQAAREALDTGTPVEEHRAPWDRVTDDE